MVCSGLICVSRVLVLERCLVLFVGGYWLIVC